MLKLINCFGQNAVLFCVDVVAMKKKITHWRMNEYLNRVLHYLALVFAQLWSFILRNGRNNVNPKILYIIPIDVG